MYASALQPSSRATIPLSARLRSWLAEAIAEEEQELSEAIHPEKGSLRDAGTGALALGVVLAASFAMERSVSVLAARFAVPAAITGAIVLAAVTSLPNAVAAVYLARRGRAAATQRPAGAGRPCRVLPRGHGREQPVKAGPRRQLHCPPAPCPASRICPVRQKT